ncbi:uncharacterized protein LOC106064843 [Biomphalaria glabrata]|uniref:Uncharacterized protein LOC106064843 n=1 Tax=Biomphalaria glabrata TaxID=6526 RepID=A0A9U8E9R1_BIOGL|nr:uncharacterized protein LOC106064843 [Biomphalaria glabrata]
MGIMPKSNRLPERPKPPSWEAVTEDIASIADDDVVFKVGKLNVASYDPTLLSEKNNLQDSDVEASDLIDSHEIESSYNDTLRLIKLYSELKDAPVRLEQQYSHLKVMGQELTQSILNLKDLAQSVSKDAEDVKLSLQLEFTPDSSYSTKSLSAKSKAKRKK